MGKKNRTILFFVLIILFLVIAPIAVFYSYGYRIDFQEKKITQTGAFYFKVFPKNVQIYVTPLDSNLSRINQKTIVKKTDFFFEAVLIDNLLPKKYEIEIKKEGFYPWKKILEIKEKMVTDAKNIVLIPENPTLSILIKGIQDLFISPDGKKIILKEANQNENKNWTLKLLELEKNLKIHLLNSNDILKNIEKKDLSSLSPIEKEEISLLDLKFSPDLKKFLLKIGLAENETNYFLLDLEKNTPSLLFLDFLGKNIESVFFHPTDNQKLLFLKEDAIFEADLLQKKISSTTLKNVSFFQVINKDVYYSLDFEGQSGFLFKNNSFFSGQEKINEIPFSSEKNKNHQLYVFLDKIFLQDQENVYTLDPDSKGFIRLFETKNQLKISPDLKKILYFSDYEIGIFFLKEDLGQPQKRRDEKELIARFSERIGDVSWLTAHYLIFNVGDKIKIAEIDDRDKINIVDFLEIKNPKIFWSNLFRRLYVLSNENLYWLELLLP